LGEFSSEGGEDEEEDEDALETHKRGSASLQQARSRHQAIK
jgi:hypothetical protein